MATQVSDPQVVKLTAQERQAFTDAYRFYERHHVMPNTVEAWEACAEDVKGIVGGYEDKGLIGSLLSALYMAIEQRMKSEEGERG